MEPTISNVQIHRLKLSTKSPALRVKPKLSIGDSLYVDSNIIVQQFPPLLKNVSLLCLQTLQSDKGISRSEFIDFTVQRPSRVILGLESKTLALHKPKWITDSGFTSISVQLYAGNV